MLVYEFQVPKWKCHRIEETARRYIPYDYKLHMRKYDDATITVVIIVFAEKAGRCAEEFGRSITKIEKGLEIECYKKLNPYQLRILEAELGTYLSIIDDDVDVLAVQKPDRICLTFIGNVELMGAVLREMSNMSHQLIDRLLTKGR